MKTIATSKKIIMRPVIRSLRGTQWSSCGLDRRLPLSKDMIMHPGPFEQWPLAVPLAENSLRQIASRGQLIVCPRKRLISTIHSREQCQALRFAHSSYRRGIAYDH